MEDLPLPLEESAGQPEPLQPHQTAPIQLEPVRDHLPDISLALLPVQLIMYVLMQPMPMAPLMEPRFHSQLQPNYLRQPFHPPHRQQALPRQLLHPVEA